MLLIFKLFLKIIGLFFSLFLHYSYFWRKSLLTDYKTGIIINTKLSTPMSYLHFDKTLMTNLEAVKIFKIINHYLRNSKYL